jgi:hypothetical protein
MPPLLSGLSDQVISVSSDQLTDQVMIKRILASSYDNLFSSFAP